MSELRSRLPHIEGKNKPAAVRLSTDEILGRTTPPTIEASPVARERFAHFINNNVIGLDLQGVTFLSVDFDPREGNLDPHTRTLIAGATVVMPEYFPKDLQRHGIFIGSKYTALFERLHKGSSVKLEHAQLVADTCRDLNKPVAVTDIANSPLYEALYLANRVPGQIFTPALGNMLLDTHPLIGTAVFAYSAYVLGLNIQEWTGRGIFNQEKLTQLDAFFFGLEQARRLYAAKGTEHLVQTMLDTNPDRADKGTIVALYPRAHGKRIADVLEHPGRLRDTLRGLPYKGLPLDYYVRHYRYNNHQDAMNDGWELVDKQKIKLLSRRS